MSSGFLRGNSGGDELFLHLVLTSFGSFKPPPFGSLKNDTHTKEDNVSHVKIQTHVSSKI